MYGKIPSDFEIICSGQDLLAAHFIEEIASWNAGSGYFRDRHHEMIKSRSLVKSCSEE